MTRAHRKQQLTVSISGPQLDLLRKLNFPCSEEVLATAALTDEGFELTASFDDFEELVGWVAAEANHTRSSHRAELLNDIADELEAALHSHHIRP